MKRIFLLTALSAITLFVSSQTLIPYTDGNKWGYCDQDMKIVIPLQYQECEPFYPNGLAIIRTTNTSYHLLNKKGEKVFDFGIHFIDQMNNEVMVYHDSRLYNFFNIREQKKYEESFTYLGIFSEGLAPYISKSDKKDIGYINLKGEKFFQKKFETVGSFHEGLAMVSQKGKIGYIGTDGKFVIKPQYDDAGDFSNGIAYVVMEDKLGYIDRSGKMVIPQAYDFIHDYVCTYRDNLVIAQKEGKKGCIDNAGTIILPFIYENLFYKGEGFFEAQINDKRKLIDKSGREILGEDLDPGGEFSEGWIAVERKDGKGSFMNKEGNYLLPFIVDVGLEFENGFARCSYDGKYFYIDRAGKMYCTFAMPFETLSPAIRDILARGELIEYINGKWIVRKDGLINVYETSGMKALPQNFVVFQESSNIVYLKDDQGKYHFYTKDKFEKVIGEPESILRRAVMTDELMAWYKSYSDTVPFLRKTKQMRFGDQIWAIEDLKVRRFRNGVPIPEAKTPMEFSEISKKKQPCYYRPKTGIDEDSSYVYNYYAIKDKRGLIPQGWKMPSRKQWYELLNFAGGDTIAGNYLSRLGFNNLGWLMSEGQDQRTIPAWWTADQSGTDFYYSIMMFLPLGGLMKEIDYTSAECGISIRCIRE
jgi:uncharacterized protein (TIGR02145 family)